ncbi:pantoate--beta-alanine ligase [Bradyrhizobium cytisi]|uniref:pantoate--beta-alanine ligase n=1 Tax=Bradyrhizobium cytisi TaxID=515489 RepID=UPI001653146C
MRPAVALIGQKKFNRAALVRGIGVDPNLPIEIVTVPAVREPDGLAMSNRHLREEQCHQAVVITCGLFVGERAFRSGERQAESLISTRDEAAECRRSVAAL